MKKVAPYGGSTTDRNIQSAMTDTNGDGVLDSIQVKQADISQEVLFKLRQNESIVSKIHYYDKVYRLIFVETVDYDNEKIYRKKIKYGDYDPEQVDIDSSKTEIFFAVTEEDSSYTGINFFI